MWFWEFDTENRGRLGSRRLSSMSSRNACPAATTCLNLKRTKWADADRFSSSTSSDPPHMKFYSNSSVRPPTSPTTPWAEFLACKYAGTSSLNFSMCTELAIFTLRALAHPKHPTKPQLFVHSVYIVQSLFNQNDEPSLCNEDGGNSMASASLKL